MDTKRGFTLLEAVLAAAILAFCLCGLLLTYANLLVLADLSRDFTLATNALQEKMEEVKKTDYGSLALGGSAFNLTDYGFPYADSKGNITVGSAVYNDLKSVRLTASFKSRGRTIGEDANFNGQLDAGAGEDANGNGRLDSPAEVVTLIAR